MKIDDLSPYRDALKRLASRVVKLELQEVLFVEGEASAELYLIASGSVEILRGGRVIQVVGGTGTIFGEMSSLRGERRSATVRAAEPTMLLAFDGGRIDELLQAVPPLASRMVRSMADRLANMNQLHDQSRARIDFLEKRVRVLLTQLGRTDEIQLAEPAIDPEKDFAEAPADPLEDPSVPRPTTQEYRLSELNLRGRERDLGQAYGNPNAAAARAPEADLWTRLASIDLGSRLLERWWRDLGDHFSIGALAAEWDLPPERMSPGLASLVEAGLVVLGQDGGFFRLPERREVWEALARRFGGE